MSPLIGGKAIKGPAAKMFEEMGLRPSASSIASHYVDLLDGFILDQVDAAEKEAIRAEGIAILTTDTIMITHQKRVELAKEVIEFGLTLLEEQPKKI